MPIIRILKGTATSPEMVARLNRAYEETLRALCLVDRNDPIAEMVARKIIEIGQTGLDDPKRISAEALKQLRIDWLRNS
jgi:hypothetical protein